MCISVMRANEFVSTTDCAPSNKIELALGVARRCPGQLVCLINTDKLICGDVSSPDPHFELVVPAEEGGWAAMETQKI